MWMAWVSLHVCRSMQVQSFLVKRGSKRLHSMMQVSNLQLHNAHAFAFIPSVSSKHTTHCSVRARSKKHPHPQKRAWPFSS